MKSEIKRTQRDYPPALKLAVIEQVEKGEFTCKGAQRKYGIQGHMQSSPRLIGARPVVLETGRCTSLH